MSEDMMKAVRCSHGEPHLVQVPRPSGEGVRIKVAATGICGSDLHLMASDFPVTATYGHEISGFTPNGMPVAIEPIAACGECPACKTGAYNHCTIGMFAAVFGVGRDGGMAEEMIVPERCLVPLPGGLPVGDACLVEPLAVAVHGVAMLDLTPGSRVAVVGGGAIGLCAVAVVRKITADVTLLARHDVQRAAGERLGAKSEPSGDYDAVFDCAGTAESFLESVRLCRPAAKLQMLATYWGGLTVPVYEVSGRELRLFSSANYARNGAVRDVDIAATLLARNPAIAPALITHRLPLDAAVEAFGIARDRAAGAIKVVLEP